MQYFRINYIAFLQVFPIDNSHFCEYHIDVTRTYASLKGGLYLVDVFKLKNAIKASNHTIRTLSIAIGIDESTFYRKLSKEGSAFTLEQANSIKRELKLNAKAAQDIFFSPDRPA